LSIPDPDPDFLPIPDPGDKGTGSRTRIRNTADISKLLPYTSDLLLRHYTSDFYLLLWLHKPSPCLEGTLLNGAWPTSNVKNQIGHT
jgi:hypothetical protein